MAADIARKLWLTAALVGAFTRKELAAAFRRVNPATTFDVERAHKWLQGRAQPRERRVYEDWALLVDVGAPADWIADCSAEAFLDRLCARHALAREALLRRAEVFGRGAARGPEAHGRQLELVGTYACYSHAWSPYRRGCFIRATLSITAAPGPQHLLATYTEALPTRWMRFEGAVTMAERALHLDLCEPKGSARLLFCLFPPTSPVSVLGGLMSGATIIGPEPQPCVTRIVMVRLPTACPPPGTSPDPYLPPDVSLAGDITTLGLMVAAPDLVDRALAAFLCDSDGGGVDRLPGRAHRAMVDLFDRQWFGSAILSTSADVTRDRDDDGPHAIGPMDAPGDDSGGGLQQRVDARERLAGRERAAELAPDHLQGRAVGRP